MTFTPIDPERNLANKRRVREGAAGGHRRAG